MKLNERIRLLRKSKGVSQTYMAKQLKLSISGYNMKELGKRPITTNELEEIAKTLNVSASIFFDGKIHEKCNPRNKEAI
jgi:transcriptional regulator with XRE-family HTH domain